MQEEQIGTDPAVGEDSSTTVEFSQTDVQFMRIIMEKEKELGRKMTHEEIEEQKIIMTNEAKIAIEQVLENGDISRSKLGLCKNDGCFNAHRTGSTYCQECSDKWHKENDKI